MGGMTIIFSLEGFVDRFVPYKSVMDEFGPDDNDPEVLYSEGRKNIVRNVQAVSVREANWREFLAKGNWHQVRSK